MANLEKVTRHFFMLQKIFCFPGGSGCLGFGPEAKGNHAEQTT
jgi:hypothetical protein